jgi:hypothetical protein
MRRLYFTLVIVFWLTMNTLLWRSEMTRTGHSGSALPAQLVWDRVLTAPDDSSLDLFHRGVKIGHCRWVANVIEPPTAATAGTDARTGEPAVVEGRVAKVAGYVLDLEGNFLVGEGPHRLRFTARIELGPGQDWRTFLLRLNLRPEAWEVRADAASETLSLRAEGSGATRERRLAFADLRRPEVLLGALGLPPSLAWLGPLAAGPGLGSPPAAAAHLALGLRWEARTDWLTVSHSRLRVFRVEARLFDKYRAVAYISRVGELLRIELPEELALVNEALVNLSTDPRHP